MRHSDYLKSLGATHVLDRNAPLSSLSGVVKDITKVPIHVIYAAISNPDIQNSAYDLLAPGGTLVIVLPNAVEESKRIPEKYIADIFGSVFLPDRRQLGVELYKNISAWFASGELKVRHRGFFPNNVFTFF